MFRINKNIIAVLVVSCVLLPIAAQAQTTANTDAPLLMAAGSLRDAMNDMMRAYRAQGGAQFIVQYGPSGKLWQEIEAGKRADVFASADVKHTEALASAKLLGASTVFAHNDLCVIAQPQLDLSENNLIQKLLASSVRVAASTPVSDPMGDYTWEFFRNADKQQPGAYVALDKKALKLSGATAPKPGEKLPYVTAFENNKTDAYVMYCTNAATTKESLPHLLIVHIPSKLNVRSAYGIAAHSTSKKGEQFVRFVLSVEGQNILKKYGFN